MWQTFCQGILSKKHKINCQENKKFDIENTSDYHSTNTALLMLSSMFMRAGVENNGNEGINTKILDKNSTIKDLDKKENTKKKLENKSKSIKKVC